VRPEHVHENAEGEADFTAALQELFTSGIWLIAMLCFVFVARRQLKIKEGVVEDAEQKQE